MQRRNPFITITASIAGIFLLIGTWLYVDRDFWWNTNIKLKDFDTIMGVGIGINLALGVLQGIRDRICNHFKLRFSGVKSDVSDKSKSLVANSKITEAQAQNFEKSTDNLSLSIENNKAHTILHAMGMLTAIPTATIYLILLTITAFHPAKMVAGFYGVFIAVFVLLPLGIYILSVSILAAYPEHKLRKVLSALNEFGDVVVNGCASINPVAPTK